MIHLNTAYRLDSESTETLLDKEESGMGYQLVLATAELTRWDRLAGNFVVVNGEIAVRLEDNYFSNNWTRIRAAISTAIHEMQGSQIPRLTLSGIDVLPGFGESSSQVCTDAYYRDRGRKKGGRGAVDSPQRNATKEDRAVRVSAFENDRRIDYENKCLRKGSFTTTLGDHKLCLGLEDDPIDRYALPSEREIKYSFFIDPKVIDSLKHGVVQPAFNKCGGGEEFFFPDGTSHQTPICYGEYGKVPHSS